MSPIHKPTEFLIHSLRLSRFSLRMACGCLLSSRCPRMWTRTGTSIEVGRGLAGSTGIYLLDQGSDQHVVSSLLVSCRRGSLGTPWKQICQPVRSHLWPGLHSTHREGLVITLPWGPITRPWLHLELLSLPPLLGSKRYWDKYLLHLTVLKIHAFFKKTKQNYTPTHWPLQITCPED